MIFDEHLENHTSNRSLYLRDFQVFIFPNSQIGGFLWIITKVQKVVMWPITGRFVCIYVTEYHPFLNNQKHGHLLPRHCVARRRTSAL